MKLKVQNKWDENIFTFVSSIASAGGLAQFGATIYSGTEMTNLEFRGRRQFTDALNKKSLMHGM